MEIHEDIYNRVGDMRTCAMKKLESHGLGSRTNWLKFVQAIEEQSGAPVDITR